MSDVRAVAQALSITPRRVQQLAGEGILPRAGRGVYDIDACRVAYDGYRQAVEAGRGGASDFETVRARKIDAQARAQELRLALQRGEATTTAAVVHKIETTIWALRNALLNLPPRISGRLASGRDPALRSVLRDECATVLALLRPAETDDE